MKLLRPIIYLSFLGYWVITFLFTMPDNYISLQYYKQNQWFQALLFQRWGFFAPPPNYDERLYYEFRDKQTRQTQTFEVLAPICDMKQQKAPFNWHEDIVDYLLSGSMTGISDDLNEMRQDLQFKHRQQARQAADTTGDHSLREGIQAGVNFRTLQNYAGIVAQKNRIDPARHEVRLILSHLLLSKFADRFSTAPRREEAFFVSDYVTLNR
ncbi:hypothetical protein F0L74_10835 [Chitinophaga agrisoli]|uniref:Uncharacterized protein n=1 Tax=Chitinophaga agrisoli TaxID=2607653 RepID=A0A5B2VWM3_9BACT|nr:hypothetical protein [Chitinophaga agrisoli]KAA2243008.1 hypothetical protein F0L74_10835 [Chitinophaga agrisoli]